MKTKHIKLFEEFIFEATIKIGKDFEDKLKETLRKDSVYDAIKSSSESIPELKRLFLDVYGINFTVDNKHRVLASYKLGEIVINLNKFNTGLNDKKIVDKEDAVDIIASVLIHELIHYKQPEYFDSISDISSIESIHIDLPELNDNTIKYLSSIREFQAYSKNFADMLKLKYKGTEGALKALKSGNLFNYYGFRPLDYYVELISKIPESKNKRKLIQKLHRMIVDHLDDSVGEYHQDDRGNLIKQYVKGTYTVNADGTLDVEGDVILNMRKYIFHPNKIPIQFGKVSGNFDCNNILLKNLQGAPSYVGGNFNCSRNPLKSLQGAPSYVGGNFDCGRNPLKSLQGAPSYVGGNFNCRNNFLTTLEGAPSKVGGNFDCNKNKLTNLQGAPSYVGGNFDCGINPLTTLQGAPREVGGNFDCRNNFLTTLEGAPSKVGGNFDCNNSRLIDDNYVPIYIGGNFGRKDNPKPKQFTEDDVRKVCDVEGNIIV